MPVTALYQLKKIGAQALPNHGISIVEGLQLRSLTGQVSLSICLSIRPSVRLSDSLTYSLTHSLFMYLYTTYT